MKVFGNLVIITHVVSNCKIMTSIMKVGGTRLVMRSRSMGNTLKGMSN